jgi:hypothetical protein
VEANRLPCSAVRKDETSAAEVDLYGRSIRVLALLPDRQRLNCPLFLVPFGGRALERWARVLFRPAQTEDRANAVLLSQGIAGSEAVDQKTVWSMRHEANTQGAVFVRMPLSWREDLIAAHLPAKPPRKRVEVNQHREPP